MNQIMIDRIDQMRPGGLNAAAIADKIWTIVHDRGSAQVSMDNDGSVYATPPGHPFSKAMLLQYGDRVVGTYARGTTSDDILEDLIEQWRTDREAAA